MLGHPSARCRSCRVSLKSLFRGGCIFSFILKQRVPPRAALSPAADPAPAVCSALVCPPATEAEAHWWLTSGCRGSLWTLERARIYHASANTKGYNNPKAKSIRDSQGKPPTCWPRQPDHPHRDVRISSLINRETSYFNLTFRQKSIKICIITDANYFLNPEAKNASSIQQVKMDNRVFILEQKWELGFTLSHGQMQRWYFLYVTCVCQEMQSYIHISQTLL